MPTGRSFTKLWPALILAVAVSMLSWSGLIWRVDNIFYDAFISKTGQRADGSIIIVAIDEKSLAELGRWPWPRELHAELLERIRDLDVRGVAIDVLFSDPDRYQPESDRQFAAAIRRHGRVVLPVGVSPSEPGGPPIELMPIPALSAAAAGLGHIGTDVDPDGVVRGAYLYAGLGDAHWPILALAMYQLWSGSDSQVAPLGLRNRDRSTGGLAEWRRDAYVRIPFVASGAGFKQVSYVDVLRGRVQPDLLRGRWLLVGATAAGMGDYLLTPLSFRNAPASGVEYHATLLNMLLQRSAIVPLRGWPQLLLAMALVVLPFLLQIGLSSRWRWWTIPTLAAMLTLALSAGLMWWAQRWFAPAATLIVHLIVLIVLGLLRLRKSQRLAHSDPLTRLANRRLFDIVLQREVTAARRSERPVALLMVDVDFFKSYNDTYGHKAGDQLLREVATLMSAHVRRPRDLAARYGGDELAAILPDTALQQACKIADTIVRSVADQAIPHASSKVATHATVTIGVATLSHAATDSHSSLLDRADAALYEAKQNGRNGYAAAASPGD